MNQSINLDFILYLLRTFKGNFVIQEGIVINCFYFVLFHDSNQQKLTHSLNLFALA
jgi:hypothetical protein